MTCVLTAIECIKSVEQASKKIMIIKIKILLLSR